MYIFCIIVIVLSVLMLIRSILHIGDAETKQRAREFIETSDKLTSAYNSNSVKKVKDSIDKLDVAYQQTSGFLGSLGESMYSEDRFALREHLHELEQDKWQKKADKYLQEFIDCYSTIVNGELESFKDVELLFKLKKRCIDQWQKYFAIDLSEYETTIYPKRHFREWMGDEYDPCMESHEALEKKLSSIVDTMRPEYKRKKALYDIVVSFVSSHGSIARADLLKKSFDGYITDEVKCCYRALVRDNRLVEIKMGGKYFVSLSDKESVKKSKQAPKEEQKVIARSDKLVHDAIVKHLMDEGVEYIDMTHKGGGLYFFSESIAEDLKSKGYNIGFAEKGSRSTSGRPAWYLRQ